MQEEKFNEQDGNLDQPNVNGWAGGLLKLISESKVFSIDPFEASEAMKKVALTYMNKRLQMLIQEATERKKFHAGLREKSETEITRNYYSGVEDESNFWRTKFLEFNEDAG